MNSSRKVALVTGASSGIGLDFARQLAADGYELFLVARSSEKLREIAKQLGNAHVIVADLTRDEAPQKVFDASGPVDVLVNNAGFGIAGPFSSTDLQRELDMIKVNIAALTTLTKLYLRPMIERRSGHIVNVAST